MNEETLLKKIIADKKIMLGKPVIRGTRLTVEMVSDKAAFGATFDEIKNDYPFLTDDDIRAALLYASKLTSDS